MKKLLTIVLILLSYLVSSSGNATNYYSDPTNGSMINSGTSTKPWASLSSIFAANRTFTAGDTIFLRNGNHGSVSIKGVNSGFVVITPEVGQNPVISRVIVSDGSATSFWKLYKLIIQSESSGVSLKGDYPLVEIFPNASNITVSSCDISSNPITTSWTRDDWRTRCNWGISTRSRLNANYIIEDNIIKNVSFGLSISSSNTIVRRNTVQYFTNDASRVLGSDVLFEKNRITDLVKVMTVLENHDDLFQAFTYAAGGTGQDTLKNVILRGNTFISTTDTSRPFVGSPQGIGCFDGIFQNWIVENNVVITDHFHGISFYDAINCKIMNNTVLDPYLVSPIDPYDLNSSSIGPAWILVSTKGILSCSGNVVRNNLVANSVSFSAPTMGVSSNNIIIGAISNYTKYFVNTSNIAVPGSFDLHLKAGCTAIDAGTTTDAPLTDMDGIARPQGAKVDIGAYEYKTITTLDENCEMRNSITIFPNPFVSTLSLESEAGFAKNAQISIYSINGQLQFSKIISEDTNTLNINNLDKLPTGIYILKTATKQGDLPNLKLLK